MSSDVEALQTALAKLLDRPPADLTNEEVAELRKLLDGVRAWKMVGKMVLWAIVTLGGIAAAISAIRGQGWFGGS